MSKLAWYYHRLRAMSGTEMLSHAIKKGRQFRDTRTLPQWSSTTLVASGEFPKLPNPAMAAPVVCGALARDAAEILAGRWKAFGHLPIQVDDPPKWHKDYLADQDLATTRSAFKLDHRALSAGADVKLIWELSRWYQLTRLAMAAYVLGDTAAASKCVEWLENWVKHNPPYTGWNWTSALEVGMRLIQFTWIDGLLTEARLDSQGDPLTPALSPKGAREEKAAGLLARLAQLRQVILPAHVHYCWRYRSFGSSANNHLLGELTGLLVASIRWPALAEWCVPLDQLRQRWEHEILAQFAPDGGNREQALNYQLFSWEFGWQGVTALQAAGHPVSPEVVLRLEAAANFFVQVQSTGESWDYGDSDSAYVLPCALDESQTASEWREWMLGPQRGQAMEYWWPGEQIRPGSKGVPLRAPWLHFPQSGHAVCRKGRWLLRWDLSPLGYLRTAAHGHLDALHVSSWLDELALVIDPGTGAYYADKRLRAWLASRPAHNGPCPAGPEWPRRLGPFLWANQHEPPVLEPADAPDLAQHELRARLQWETAAFARSVNLRADHSGYDITDRAEPGATEFSTRWQFPPDATLEQINDRRFRVTRPGFSVEVEVGAEWAEVFGVPVQDAKLLRAAAVSDLEAEFAGTVSPAFRRVEWGPFLKLVARPPGNQPCVFRTTFLASPRA